MQSMVMSSIPHGLRLADAPQAKSSAAPAMQVGVSLRAFQMNFHFRISCRLSPADALHGQKVSLPSSIPRVTTDIFHSQEQTGSWPVLRVRNGQWSLWN